MAPFFEDLWNSIFTPGPTPTLLVATNASFAALQFILLVLLVATYSIHFVVLSLLCAGLWWSINWFVAELEAGKAKEDAKMREKEKSPEPEKSSRGGSDTETEMAPPPIRPAAPPPKEQPALLKPRSADAQGTVRHRRSQGDSSGYVSTDSEWEKVSEGDDKDQ
jgi:ER protein Pkr1